ncbi:PilZ domain-containing protein [Marinobacter sp. X15-166B]|uniref:PilZ domain-containing protein n=1 Tax=Marinobacter sp. X15-166B TaxID=1897620 RepID=UPI00085BEF91|nr:PilZ domain-containing protein [Marinobacter sp. X15-166B]OEY65217.1 pilus assembly protein PilZ [Marinobacter sp. X15-166B]
MNPVIAKPNLRSQQRVDSRVDVTLITADGASVQCATANLSRSGIMVHCDLPAYQTLLPQQISPAPGNWVPVATKLFIPVVASQIVCIEAEGHMVNLRRIARNDFYIGIQFKQFKGNGFDYLSQYVRRLLVPLENLPNTD